MGETNFKRNTVIVYASLANVNGPAYYILLLITKKYYPGNEALQELLRKQSRKGLL